MSFSNPTSPAGPPCSNGPRAADVDLDPGIPNITDHYVPTPAWGQPGAAAPGPVSQGNDPVLPDMGSQRPTGG